MLFYQISALFLSCALTLAINNSLRTLYKWKVLEFGFPSNEERQFAIDNGLYDEAAGVPIDVDAQRSRYEYPLMRVFVTIPKFTAGIPFTLGYVSDESGPNGPLIQPYPSYDWHYSEDQNCDIIISAFRVAIDECNHMWVIDSGVDAGEQICPPKLLKFDLDSDKLIGTYVFPENVYTPGESLFITPAVDVNDPPPWGNCQDVMVYIADSDTPGLVVYDSMANASWRIESDSMKPDPAYVNQSIAGQSFELADGIFSIVLTPRFMRPEFREYTHERPMRYRHERYLFFHPQASTDEYAINLRYVNNKAIWEGNPQARPELFMKLGSRGIQVSQEAIDCEGNIFTNTNDQRIIVWNTDVPYTERSLRTVAYDSERLQFASGMKVISTNGPHQELWILTNRYQKIASDTLDPNETNFRILTANTNHLLGRYYARYHGRRWKR